MNDCIFCKIINKELPAKIHYEDEDMLIFEDINKKAKLHYLMILKEHFKLLKDMSDKTALSLGKCLKKVGELADSLGLQNGFRVIINQGENGNQTVFHLHCHILGGQKLN